MNELVRQARQIFHPWRREIKTSGYARASGCEFVRDSLRRFVSRRKLSQGDRLPSEIALAKEFGISRAILREAYRLLERDGVIVVRGGAGTYLGAAFSPVTSTLNELSGIGTLIRKAGLEPSAEIQRLEHRPAEREWAEKLGLRENAPVVVMRRLRKADGQPIALAWNVFIEEQVGQTLESGIWQDSIFLHMETRCGVKIASARTLICALRPDCPYDRLAKETLGDSALLMRRLHFDLKGAPVLYSLDYIRTDLVDLIVRQQRGFY